MSGGFQRQGEFPLPSSHGKIPGLQEKSISNQGLDLTAVEENSK